MKSYPCIVHAFQGRGATEYKGLLIGFCLAASLALIGCKDDGANIDLGGNPDSPDDGDSSGDDSAFPALPERGDFDDASFNTFGNNRLSLSILPPGEDDNFDSPYSDDELITVSNDKYTSQYAIGQA